MFLKKLNLLNFKNHLDFSAEFIENCNCIVGQNGSGKTNILDAIYFLCMTKSAFLAQDAACVNHNEAYFMIKGSVLNENKKTEILCSYSDTDKKQIKIDKKTQAKMSDHIGQYPIVIISPTDTDIIREGSEIRRKFVDSLLCQIDAEYLSNLLIYNKILVQRNALLRQFGERNYFDAALLDTYTEPMAIKVKLIAHRRQLLVDEIMPFFIENYEFLSDHRENVGLKYTTDVKAEGTFEQFRQNYQADQAAGRSTLGVHKDDFIFEIDGHALKKFGSQGQQKSYILALKLAQFQLMHQQKGKKPLLLMDDIFDKLDDRRIQRLINLMENGSFGQVFVTDARPERSRAIFEPLGTNVKFLELN